MTKGKRRTLRILRKKLLAVKPEKKTNERELNKKSESQQIQDEQKDLRAYATKVEEERKAKELAQQTAKEEAEAKRQAEIAEQQRQQKIAEEQRVAAQQAEKKKEAESPVSQETIDNYEANQAETWAKEAEIEKELNAEAVQEDTQSEEYYRKRAEEEKTNLKEGETPKWTGDPWVDSQTEWAEMTPEEQKQWQEDNLSDLDEDIQ
ncbi:hypothetical protein [Priestia aryabhattai]|uniref:hypothetical protein n=1 Tax=Priestia aryabhattai TaxID=412384 RepID=UPI003D2BE8AE